MKRILIIFILLVTNNMLYAQFGEIRGRVTDKLSGQPLPGASISYSVNGSLQGVAANEAGDFVIKPLTSGSYDLKVSFVTYKSYEVKNVLVSAEKATYVNFTLDPDNDLPIIDVYWEPPMIDPGVTPTMTVLGPNELKHSVDRGVIDRVATVGGVFQRDQGGSLNIRGSRGNSTLYVVDGIKMYGDFSVPNSAIQEITVITGGIPAQYGDATGGVVVITTKKYKMR